MNGFLDRLPASIVEQRYGTSRHVRVETGQRRISRHELCDGGDREPAEDIGRPQFSRGC